MSTAGDSGAREHVDIEALKHIVQRNQTWPRMAAKWGVENPVPPWKTSLDLSAVQPREGLSVFWARAKIESLMNDQVNGLEPETTRHSVIDVALRHHLEQSIEVHSCPPGYNMLRLDFAYQATYAMIMS